MKEQDREMLQRFANAMSDVRHSIQIQQAEQDETAKEAERAERIAAENHRQDMIYFQQLRERTERRAEQREWAEMFGWDKMSG